MGGVVPGIEVGGVNCYFGYLGVGGGNVVDIDGFFGPEFSHLLALLEHTRTCVWVKPAISSFPDIAACTILNRFDLSGGHMRFEASGQGREHYGIKIIKGGEAEQSRRGVAPWWGTQATLAKIAAREEHTSRVLWR